MNRTPPLGQHFLTRPEIAEWVANAADISETDTVLEIGPGHGVLTRILLARAKRVVAIEKDPELVAELQTLFASEIADARLVLIEQDVRDFDPAQCPVLEKNYLLVANIPYYLSGMIIRTFLTSEHQPARVALLVQKEVAERAVARSGKESLLSLSIQAYGTPRLEHIVKAGAFSPPPKVDSAILAIKDVCRTRFEGPVHEQRFFRLIHTAFAQKRKQLGSTLKEIVSDEQFANCALKKDARPEDVHLETWLCVAEKMH